MGTTFALLATQTIANNSTTTFTWSSISQSYTDLQVIADIKGFSSAADTQIPTLMRINGSSTAAYNQQGISWNVSAKTDIAFNTDTAVIMTSSVLTNNFDTAARALHKLYFPRYSETNSSRKQGYYDAMIGYNSASTTVAKGIHKSWIYNVASTSGISSITIAVSGTNNFFGNGSRFYLYGIDRNA